MGGKFKPRQGARGDFAKRRFKAGGFTRRSEGEYRRRDFKGNGSCDYEK